MELTISYRERIALPPDTLLYVRIVETANPEAAFDAITSQVFKMASVPMSVWVAYDPSIIDGEASYSVAATIVSPDGVTLFQGMDDVTLTAEGTDGADLVLMMPADKEGLEAVSRTVAGTNWSVTELFGAALSGENEAILSIDKDLNLSVQGACNRFLGIIQRIGRGISVPDNMVATMMVCPPPLEELDRQLVAALARATQYVRYGSGVVLMDEKDRAVLHARQLEQ
jgi:putative lipoprotein